MLGATLLLACCAVLHGAAVSDIWFPGSRPRAGSTSTPAPAQIPVDLMLRLSSVEHFTDFVKFVDEKSLRNISTSINNRISGGDEPAEVPKHAVCMTELQVVDVIGEKSSSMVYFPTCVRIQQCGGCCLSDLLKCQPTKIEVVNYSVYATQYVGGDKMVAKEKQLVSVEKHTECRCSCIVKQKDCNERQVYEEDNCRCRCINSEAEGCCRSENNTKVWDPKMCMCFCRETQNCTTGYFFDLDTCRCSKDVENRSRIGRSRPARGYQRSPRRMLRSEVPLNYAASRQAAAPR